MALHQPSHPVRFVTAAALFDGHDAAINIMRRILQAQGAEVVHLGHNRSVEDVVTAAIQEDVQGVAVSSYQGGHLEFFGYLLDALRAAGAGHVRVYGGGGGVIVPAEVEELQARGVTRIFTPADGQRLGLAAMVNTMVADCDVDLAVPPASLGGLWAGEHGALARVITCLQEGTLPQAQRRELREASAARPGATLGITGTGGSGKSSLTDELVRRVRLDTEDKVRVAVVAIDPTRRRSGGALLGDRIRMNAIAAGAGASGLPVFFRSMATRGAPELPDCLADVVAACVAAGHDLVIVETPGIGQGDAGIVPYVDVPLYVMTPEFGAASQLEKIDMLDLAAAVVVNKFERPAAEDALRDVRKAVGRNREVFGVEADELPVFGTIAARFNDDGVTALYQYLRQRLGLPSAGVLPVVAGHTSSRRTAIVPPGRSRYLAEIAEAVRAYHGATGAQAALARRRQQLSAVRGMVEADGGPTGDLERLETAATAAIDPAAAALLEDWPAIAASYPSRVKESLSGTAVPRVALPGFEDDGERLRWLREEHLPGHFPFTAGVFPFKRDDEDPARMFAGEGDPARTNRRFHLLADGQPATRLSTAFDSVTLYGADPDPRPDVYGKVGNSGVSVATLDDMRELYRGFDLCDPATSVSMTINGPAPTILAMFLNTAIDQQVERLGHDASPDELAAIRDRVLATVRGTVQADILKEDQGQNTCIFSTDFALGLMADVQEWFVANRVRNFYAVSISGYHIAEAGADPITQLAFTLANAFTYVEAYLARGMRVDDFAPNLSFFFSNGMDPEYSVLGRVARRIWAVAMRDRYGARERAQKLKYHIQTSGRSLHAQEMAFNDIRTTLQALCAIYDNCNSLHTNAYDEAVTTPSEDSVRRALAIQLVIDREWGLAMNENPLQGSFIIEQLTDLVEEAVLVEFERLAERGGVLGAMETGYQRGQIQEQSLRYEARKHDGTLPIVGVNVFRNPHGDAIPAALPLSRSTDGEKQAQLDRLRDFQVRHAAESPATLARLRDAALGGENLFAVLMDAVRSCSLGEITAVLFDVGGQYRRNV
jgi:isobutyryl-CoA mutase